MLLYELRRKFAWVVVDLPRWVTPTQRVVLGAANRVVLFCERSLDGLRDTVRLQTFLREHAPQCQLLLVDSGAAAERAGIGKAEFEKAVGKTFDASCRTTRKPPPRRRMPASRCRSPRRAARSRARPNGSLVALRGAGIRQKRKIFGLTIR